MRILLAALLGTILWSGVATAQEMQKMSILTGLKSGTYFRFGQDIAQVISKECNAEITVKESQGSLANLQRLRHEVFSQLAIVQQDTLDYLKTAAAKDVKLQDMIKNIRYIFPLYSEEVHLVTTRNSGIKNLRDIAGKRVAIGVGESGTYLTASFILLLSGIDVEEVEIGGADALRRLLLPADDANKVDAMFYVAGTPVKLYTETPGLKDKLAAVTINEPAVLDRYNPAQLTAQDYAWIDDKVDTVKVKSVLMTYDFVGPQCLNVGMLANRVKANLQSLKTETGHAKWAEVDINAPLKGWQLYKCVKQYIDAPVGPEGERRCAFIQTTGATPGYMPPGQKTPKAEGGGGSGGSICDSAKKSDNPIVQSLCKNLKELQK
jgi:TRAP transporter TAXI family solute receptor